MPSPYQYNDFEKKMKRLGIQFKRGGRGSHIKLSKKIKGTMVHYVIAKHGLKIEDCYVKGTKRAFGISDEEFEQA